MTELLKKKKVKCFMFSCLCVTQTMSVWQRFTVVCVCVCVLMAIICGSEAHGYFYHNFCPRPGRLFHFCFCAWKRENLPLRGLIPDCSRSLCCSNGRWSSLTGEDGSPRRTSRVILPAGESSLNPESWPKVQARLVKTPLLFKRKGEGSGGRGLSVSSGLFSINNLC